MKQPATDHISGAISRIEIKVKNGKPKIHRTKIKTLMASNSPEDVKHAILDNTNSVQRNQINKEVRNDINPADGAHNEVSDTKKKISDERAILRGQI